jgi:N12 class adenine-specific DNA methylase
MPVVYGGTTLKADGTLVGKRLAALVGLRDRARRVLQSQNEGWPDANRNEARRELAHAYDRFVLAYGPVNKTTISETNDGSMIRRMPNLVKFRDDPDAMLVMSLENYDEATDKATKAAIMLRDVVGKTPPVTQVKSAEEGLLVSLNQRGIVDGPFTARIRRQASEKLTSDRAVEHNAVPELPQPSFTTPTSTFQERIAIERRQNIEGLGQTANGYRSPD